MGDTISNANLIVMIVIIVIVSFITLFLGFKFLFKKADTDSWSLKGTMILKYNPANRKITPYNLDGEKGQQKSAASTSVSRLFGLFKGSEGEKLFRNSLHEITRGTEKIEYSFNKKTRHLKKEIEIKFNVAFSKRSESKEYIINIEWKHPAASLNKFPIRRFDTNKIYKNPDMHYGFVAYHMNDYILNSRVKFLTRVKHLLGKNFHYFEKTGMLIFICWSSSEKKTNSMVDDFRDKVKVISKNTASNIYLSASAIATYTDIKSSVDLTRIISMLDFLTNISLRRKIEYVRSSGLQREEDEFMGFYKSMSNFRDIVRSGKFSYTDYDIIESSKKKVIMKYRFPFVESLPKGQVKLITTNSYYKNMFLNAHTDKIISSDDIKSPILVDATSSWMLSNISKISNKKIVFVIYFDNFAQVSEMEKIANKLKSAGHFYGIRLDSFSNFTISLIKKIKPNFLIISENLAGKNLLTGEAYIDLLSLKGMTENQDITVIYENVPGEISRDYAKKLNVNFSYSTQIK